MITLFKNRINTIMIRNNHNKMYEVLIRNKTLLKLIHSTIGSQTLIKNLKNFKIKFGIQAHQKKKQHKITLKKKFLKI